MIDGAGDGSRMVIDKRRKWKKACIYIYLYI